MSFRFELKQPVRLIASDEQGIIIGRAEFSTAENSYLVRYRAGDGRAVESWWTESALGEPPVSGLTALED